MSEERLGWDIIIDVDSEDFVLLDEGDYEFTVEKIEREVSKNQNNMLKLTLSVTDTEGHRTQVIDHLVLVKAALWKVSDFLRSIGLKEHGKEASLTTADNAIGKRGVCHLIVDEFDGNDGSKKKNNKIGRYYPQDGPNAKKPGPPKTSVKPNTTEIPW